MSLPLALYLFKTTLRQEWASLAPTSDKYHEPNNAYKQPGHEIWLPLSRAYAIRSQSRVIQVRDCRTMQWAVRKSPVAQPLRPMHGGSLLGRSFTTSPRTQHARVLHLVNPSENSLVFATVPHCGWSLHLGKRQMWSLMLIGDESTTTWLMVMNVKYRR